MKIFLKFIATILIVVGAWLSAIGFSYQSEGASYRQFAVPMAQPLVSIVKNLPREQRILLLLPEYGLLPLFGGAGGVLIMIGLLFSSIANREEKSFRAELSQKNTRVKRPTNQRVEAAPASDDNLNKVTDNSEMDDFGAVKSSDSTLADDIETHSNFADLLDINTLVSMSQSHLEQEECMRILQMFRPDLLEHKDILSEGSIYEITKQILESVILRHRRQEKDITADQFRIQDQRLSEIERKTIVRRYLPRNKEIESGAKKYVGRVYDFGTQSEIQQNHLSESEDWIDLSLRNAKDVLSMSFDGEGTAA